MVHHTHIHFTFTKVICCDIELVGKKSIEFSNACFFFIFVQLSFTKFPLLPHDKLHIQYTIRSCMQCPSQKRCHKCEMKTWKQKIRTTEKIELDKPTTFGECSQIYVHIYTSNPCEERQKKTHQQCQWEHWFAVFVAFTLPRRTRWTVSKKAKVLHFKGEKWGKQRRGEKWDGLVFLLQLNSNLQIYIFYIGEPDLQKYITMSFFAVALFFLLFEFHRKLYDVYIRELWMRTRMDSYGVYSVHKCV